MGKRAGLKARHVGKAAGLMSAQLSWDLALVRFVLQRESLVDLLVLTLHGCGGAHIQCDRTWDSGFLAFILASSPERYRDPKGAHLWVTSDWLRLPR